MLEIQTSMMLVALDKVKGQGERIRLEREWDRERRRVAVSNAKHLRLQEWLMKEDPKLYGECLLYMTLHGFFD